MEEYQNVLSSTELEKIDKYFRAANYLSVGQLYLRDNPLLRSPLKFSDIKKNIVGHWGTVPGQTFIYTHLNRIIKKYDLNIKNVKFDTIGMECNKCSNNCEILKIYKDDKLIDAWGSRCGREFVK